MKILLLPLLLLLPVLTRIRLVILIRAKLRMMGKSVKFLVAQRRERGRRRIRIIRRPRYLSRRTLLGDPEERQQEFLRWPP